MHKIYQILSFTFAVMLLASCLPNSQQVPAGEGQTQAAYTMVAVLTESVFQTVEAKLTEVSSKPTGTPVPQESSSPEAGTPGPVTTLMPAAGSPTLAGNMQSQPSSQPPSVVTGTLCNQIGSVVDVSIPDGTAIKPGATFTKIWRLKNNGSCTWTTAYALVYANGANLTVSGDKTFPMPKEVKPGETVDLSILMQAPEKGGSYISYWLLQDQYGNVFGGGSKGKGVFYVKISSGGESAPGGNASLVYDYGSSACYASWFTSNGVISCPGSADPKAGSVSVQNSVKMTGGSNPIGTTIITIPNNHGEISGQFPAILINKDTIFSGTIGCVYGHPNCDVTFTLSYKTTDGQTGTFGSWNHTQDGKSDELNIDISRIAGKNASLILTVIANNNSEDNIGFWFSPHIWH